MLKSYMNKGSSNLNICVKNANERDWITLKPGDVAKVPKEIASKYSELEEFKLEFKKDKVKEVVESKPEQVLTTKQEQVKTEELPIIKEEKEIKGE